MNQKIGPLFLVALSGKTLSSEEKEAISTLGLRHFIFFARNLESREQIKELMGELEEVAGPGLRAIDQEGGPVCRLRPPLFPKLKAPLELAREKNPEEAVALAAKLCGRKLRALGFNFNLAPVLDLAAEEAPAFLRGRTFGSEAQKVANLGEIYIKNLQEEGVFACAKHFPGLGGVKEDPHHRLPQKEKISPEDLLPFKAAIRAGVFAIMTTHLLISTPSPQVVTFSPEIIALLRQDLSFKGLILTDDLYMGGARSDCSLEEAVLQAFLAGHDLILLCGDFWQSVSVIKNFARECRYSPVLNQKTSKKLYFIK